MILLVMMLEWSITAFKNSDKIIVKHLTVVDGLPIVNVYIDYALKFCILRVKLDVYTGIRLTSMKTSCDKLFPEVRFK